MALEVDHAKGIHIYDTSGKRYYDMNSGISVSYTHLTLPTKA